MRQEGGQRIRGHTLPIDACRTRLGRTPGHPIRIKRRPIRHSYAVIAMGNSISDLAATAFAAQFYAAVAVGQSLKAAFNQGVVAIEAVSINEAKTPQLILADGVNAAKIVLA